MSYSSLSLSLSCKFFKNGTIIIIIIIFWTETPSGKGLMKHLFNELVNECINLTSLEIIVPSYNAKPLRSCFQTSNYFPIIIIMAINPL